MSNFLSRLADEARKKIATIGAPAPVQQNIPVGIASPQRLALQKQANMNVLGHSLSQVGTAAGLGFARSAVGTAQGISGISDLIGRKLNHSPTTTTSRFSKGLDGYAKGLDATAQQRVQGPARAGYKIGQASGDIAQFLLPSKALSAVSDIPKVAKVAGIVGKVAGPGEKAVGAIADKIGVNAAGRIAGAGIKAGLSPGGLVNAATATVSQSGQSASKGNAVTKADLAKTLGLNVAGGIGLGAGGQLAKEAAPALKALGKDIHASRSQAILRGDAKQSLLTEANRNDKAAKALEKKQLSLNTSSEPLQRQIDAFRGKAQQLRDSVPKQGLMQRAKDSVLTATPGLSTRDVSKLPSPEEAQAILAKDASATVAPALPTETPPAPLKPQLPEQLAQNEGALPTAPVPLQARRPGQIREDVNPRPLQDGQIASLPAQSTTDVGLNTGRLNLPEDAKANLDTGTAQTIEKMSNKQVQQIARSSGMDTKTYNIQQTRQKIAEQLNVRQNAVSLQQGAASAAASGDTERAAALLKQSAEMGRTSRTQGTDIARQLQARRIIANELDTPQQRLFKLLDNAGVNPDVYSRRLATVDFDNPKDVVTAYRDLVPAKFGDWLDKYRYTNMLSSPSTQINNLSGNLQGGAIVRPVQKLFEAGVDTAHSVLTGADRTRKAGEALSYSKGYAKALPDAFKAFGDSFLGKTAQNNPDFGDLAHSPLATKGFKGAADKILSFVPKLMESFDEASQAQIRAGETRALQYRQSKGIKTTDIEGKAQEAADYTLFRKDLGAPGQGHLLDGIDFIPQKVQEGRISKNPVIRNASKLIFPFVKTPANISKQMIEYSPLGVLTLPGNVDKTAQIAKAVMGTTLVGVTSGTLAASNRLTFATPTDAKEKQKFLAEGKQAYSFKAGNKWISYQKLHPALSFQMAAVAAVHESLTNKNMDQSTADKALTGLASISRFFVDQSYFKNAQDFLNNASGTGSVGSQAKTALASQASNIANQFVPARAAQTWLNNFIDKVQRQPDSAASGFDQFKQQFSSQIPGLSKNVPARKDNLGNDLPKQSPVLNNFSPARVSTEKNDSSKTTNALSGEVDRLARQDNSIALTSQGSKQKIAGTDVKLSGDQAKGLTTAVNNKVKNGWNQLIKTDEYKALSDEDKRHALAQVKTDYTSAAKRDYGASNNIELKNKPSKSDIAILSGHSTITDYAKKKSTDGTYVADTVNKSISSSSKNILTADKSLNSDQRKQKSYSQNDYDYKVAAAKYENDKADGKLSKAQLSSTEDALKKAKIGSNYSKDTREIYGLSKQDIYDLISTDPDGKKIASDLDAYDKQLKASGIITTAKFKNGFTPPSTTSSSSKKGSTAGYTTSTNNISSRASLAKALAGSGKGIKAQKVSLSGKLASSQSKQYKGPTLYKKAKA